LYKNLELKTVPCTVGCATQLCPQGRVCQGALFAVVLLLDSIFQIHLSMQYSGYINFIGTKLSVE